MASRTQQTETRRAMNRARAARKRKNRIAREGTTKPALPLNMPNANEKQQTESK